VNIYGNDGQPYMGGKSYEIPGPEPVKCGGVAGRILTSTMRSEKMKDDEKEKTKEN
jgi:hypothetical protein